ncbi:hypothetical protein [Rhizobium rhizogenes]|uniref:hypothetical protein n=1 Tax=Rhizobium rhizogenes TaxID=359 RepID=UPI00115AEC66|nr:hypothetical protein [Rhizobium rhizogenes]NTI80433.1 hypothetical protein [Rhizobium rhizogenes]NTJ22619.1 hypothetical protein [Rhizobium rhizogenes]QUE81323.1 hypothetical protein EML492_05820 [Rhizobium rhizogenes]TQO80579.1 hypothetical protein FFE80_05615 [Rhizobium rhizogenes]TRB52538.1 hypothetical protein EXN69_23115 [Rhizobium rhizogenes]
MTSFPSQTFVTMNISEPPDRSEFWRDAECGCRLMQPSDALNFLSSLCHARAIYENDRDRCNVDSVAKDLFEECLARGYDAVPVRHIELRGSFSLPSGDQK